MSDAVIDQSNETGMRTALGTLLIERGFLDNQKLDEALRVGADTGERLGEVVVRMGWASEDDLAKILADQWHLRYVERSEISFNGDALSRMSREEATRLEALPIQINDDGAVVVALAEPTDARLLALRSLLGDRIDCVVVTKTAIDAGLRSDLLPKNGSSPAYVADVPEVEEVENVEAEAKRSDDTDEAQDDTQHEQFDNDLDADEISQRLRRGGADAERRNELATRLAPPDRRRGGDASASATAPRSHGSGPSSPSARRSWPTGTRSCPTGTPNWPSGTPSSPSATPRSSRCSRSSGRLADTLG